MKLIVVGAACLVAAIPGQNSFAKGGGSSDETFLKKTAEANATEIKMGAMAQDKSQDAAVKDFAQKMVRDHQQAAEDLKAVVAKLGVTVSEAPKKEHQKDADRLSKLTGAEFDKAYAEAMVKDHRKVVQMFEQAAKSSNADVKAFAEKMLPTLREHLEMAQKLGK